MQKEEQVLKNIWHELSLSLVESGHPYHIFSISTVYNGLPDARNVVLRGVNEEQKSINFHTDTRSKKVYQFSKEKSVCALFYDKPKKTQLRIYGDIHIEDDKDTILKKWNDSKEMSKLCYLNKYPPGHTLSASRDYLYNEKDLKNIDKGVENFLIINLNIRKIDWLFLNHKGHERMLIDLKKNEEVKYEWIAP